MKTILKVFTLVSLAGLSLSASIVGGWQIEPQKTVENNAGKDKFATGMAMTAFDALDIYDNHRAISINADIDAKWEKNGNDYVLIDDSGRVPLKQLDDNHIMMSVKAFEVSDISLFYKRVDARKDITLDSSITNLKLGSIYRSKKIKGQYRFALINKDKKFYFLQTDKADRITIDQIKGADLSGQGSTFRDTTRVYIKDKKMYDGSNDKQIEELSPTKLRYFGADFELQE